MQLRGLVAGGVAIRACGIKLCFNRGELLLRHEHHGIDLRADAPFGPAALGTAAREEGLLLVRGGDRALRLLPPLTVTDDEIHEALARLDAALTRLSLTEGAAS